MSAAPVARGRTAVRVTPALAAVLAALLVAFAVTERFSAEALLKSLAIVAVYLGSVFIHEGAHARAARRRGMRVERITLSVVGGITAYSGPDPGASALRAIAMAGPRRSALVGLGCLAIAEALYVADWRWVLGSLAFWAAQVNLGLAVVNLLPLGTLDGAVAWRVRHSRSPRRG